MLKKIYAAREYDQNQYVSDVVELLGSPAVIGVRSGVTWASRIVDRVVGKGIATGITATELVVVYGSKFCGKTRCLGSTSMAVDTAWEVL